MAYGTGLLTRRGSNTSVSSNLTVSASQSGISLMVKRDPSKFKSAVRFRYPAPDYFTVANRKALRMQMYIQPMSNSHQFRLRRALAGSK